MSEDYLDIPSHWLESQTDHPLNKDVFPILDALSETQIRALRLNSEVIRVGKDVEIIREGAPQIGLFFVLKGELAVAKRRRREDPVRLLVIQRLHVGDVFGEYGLIIGQTRYASVITLTDCKIIRVSHKVAKQVYDANEGFRRHLSALIQRRLINSVLAAHPMFAIGEPSVRETFSSHMTIQSIPAGKKVYETGEAARLYLIVSGEVELYLPHEKKDGESTVIDIRRNGDIVGDLAFLKGATHRECARTYLDTDLLALDQETLEQLSKYNPEIPGRIMQFIRNWGARTQRRLEQVGT